MRRRSEMDMVFKRGWGPKMYIDISFQEKLQVLCQCIFPDSHGRGTDKAHAQSALVDGNEALGAFYAAFAAHRDFMKCLYDIKLPEELAVENNIMLIALERQGVCAYGVEMKTERVLYLDHTNGVAEPLDMQIDDFILYLTAIQCTAFRPCAGTIPNGSGLINDRYHSLRITNNSGDCAVYLFEDGVILVVSGNDAFVSARDDRMMEAFEANTGFEVDCF